MDVNEKYFSNITARERAIFEGGISMGALFHQFVGTPFNKSTVGSLEKAMEEKTPPPIITKSLTKHGIERKLN